MVDEESIPENQLMHVSKENDGSETESDDVVAVVAKKRNIALVIRSVQKKESAKPRAEEK